MSFEDSRAYQTVMLILETVGTIGDMDMRALQEEHGFTKKRIIRLEFIDEHKYYLVQLADGKIRPLIKLPMFKKNPDIELRIKEMCTLKHLRIGQKRYIQRDPVGNIVSNKVKVYTPRSAYNFNDVFAKNYGEDSGEVTDEWLGRTNENFQAISLLMKVMKAIPPERLMVVIGPCEHDV